MLDRGRARKLVRELSVEEAEELRGVSCFVHHPDAGGECANQVVMEVYGIRFCEMHGAEARIGALSELYEDAANLMDRVSDLHVSSFHAENQEALAAFGTASSAFMDRMRGNEDGELQVLQRTYPVIPERVCCETKFFDYEVYDRDTPQDMHLHDRRFLHRMMREAYQEGADWLVEMLEYEREHIAAQAAFAIEDYNRRVGAPSLPES